MRRPEFWRTDRAAARLLAPAAWAYGAAAWGHRALAKTEPAPVPVICVGNLIAGGAGKTPVAIAIGAALVGQGRAVHFLSRGYGGRDAGPLRVEPDRHGAEQVGDEPLLLARIAPTWVARDRPGGAAAAAAAGADLIVMDDGLQNPSLAKTRSIVVVDGGYGFGNGRLLPAGPLREPIPRGLARADAVVLIEPDTVGVGATLGPDVIRARIVPAHGAEAIAGTPVTAFAGIAEPAKLFRTLAELGCPIVAAHGFADHHRYTEAEMMKLIEEAGLAGTTLVTTAKDAIRLPPEMREMVTVLDVMLEWEAEGAIDALIGSI